MTGPDGGAARRRRYQLSRDALILHCPGPLRHPRHPVHREWEAAKAAFFADDSTRGACGAHDDLTIITYNTRSAPCLLERCVAHLGVSGLVVLGGEKDDWSLEYKISLVLDYLRSRACRSEYVLCLDGDDVLVLADPGLILARFLRVRCEALFTSTAWDWPPSRECWEFESSVAAPADHAHCHLNSGGYLARRGYLMTALTEVAEAMAQRQPWCDTPQGFDDQLAWRHMHRRYHPAIRVDARCEIFIRFDANR